MAFCFIWKISAQTSNMNQRDERRTVSIGDLFNFCFVCRLTHTVNRKAMKEIHFCVFDGETLHVGHRRFACECVDLVENESEPLVRLEHPKRRETLTSRNGKITTNQRN